MGSDGPNWPGKLKGRHRQVVDAIEINAGFPLAFAYTFLITNPSPGAATAVVVLRHEAFLMSLNSAMWAKYKIGESIKLIDPETQAVTVKNPYLNPKPGVLPVDAMAVDRLLASGTIFGACNIALTVLSKKMAGNAGVSADDAAKEWAANVVPGITIIPSGTWGGEPRAGSRLLVLRGRLIAVRSALQLTPEAQTPRRRSFGRRASHNAKPASLPCEWRKHRLGRCCRGGGSAREHEPTDQPSARHDPHRNGGRTVGDLNFASNDGHESNQTAAKPTKRPATALGNADRSVD